MIELAAISSFGGGGVNIRQSVETTPQAAVLAVENSLAGQGLSSQMSSGYSQSDQSHTNTGSRQQSTPQKAVDPNPLTGPPPTFLMNVLEMDRDLAQSLARMNAEHTFPKEPAPVSSDASAEPEVAAPEQPEIKAVEHQAEPEKAPEPEVAPEESAAA